MFIGVEQQLTQQAEVRSYGLYRTGLFLGFAAQGEKEGFGCKLIVQSLPLNII